MENKEKFKNEYYFLNKDTYKKDFLPIYQQAKIHPKKIFQSAVILPFHIPIQSGTCVTMVLDEEVAFTLVFGEAHTTNKFTGGIVRSEPFEIPISKTVAEIILVTGTGKFTKEEDTLEFDIRSYLFDLCIEKLNYFITSYLITTKDTSVHQVTIRMFEVASAFRIIEPIKWIYELGLFIFHDNAPYKKPELPSDFIQNVTWFANVINQNWNPFILFEELMLNSKRNFNEGFHIEAVIYCQTAFETFIRVLLLEFYKEEGKSELELNQKFDESSFIGVLKREFHSRINGKWDITDTSTKLGAWYKHCYLIRNRVIHAGYRPIFPEVGLALFSTDEVITSIIKLTNLKKKKYPKVVELIKNKEKNSP